MEESRASSNASSSASLRELYRANAVNELTEHLVYAALAARQKDAGNRETLERLSAQELSHYEFWKSLLAKENPAAAEALRPRNGTIAWMRFLRAILGVTFLTKLLEGHEHGAPEQYEAIRALLPADAQERLSGIIEDERSHERALIGQIKEARVNYIGFIVLGLADAIVEITGVHAGFLGVTGSTLIAGVAGVIVGFAAAISMGSAAYLQAKQDTTKSAIASGMLTGFSYFASVILLALPYFLIRTMITAFAISTSLGVLLIAGFTIYGAVVFERKFWREFGEAAALLVGTAVATFVWGAFIGNLFHVHPSSF